MNGFTLDRTQSHLGLDGWLFGAFAGLALFGLVMVGSASVAFGEKMGGSPTYYFWRQAMYLVGVSLIALLLFRIRLELWQRYAWLALVLAFVLLLLVPVIGVSVKGARRWLDLGLMRLQVSEPARLAYLLWLASYLTRRRLQARDSLHLLAVPLIVMAFMALLFILEPDFGATVILGALALTLLFLAGTPRRYMLGLIVSGSVLVTLAVWLEPYRMRRFTGFLDPFADPKDTGYQLINALTAITSGGWTGLGWGNSVQKLLYLPEMHTDFIFAVMVEELGLLAMAVLLLLYGVIVVRAVRIAVKATERGDTFGTFLVYGLTIWLCLQVLLNLGVNLGLLPTKGLTLPLVSYGGSSLLTVFLMMMFILRVDYENRLLGPQKMRSPTAPSRRGRS